MDREIEQWMTAIAQLLWTRAPEPVGLAQDKNFFRKVMLRDTPPEITDDTFKQFDEIFRKMDTILEYDSQRRIIGTKTSSLRAIATLISTHPAITGRQPSKRKRGRKKKTPEEMLIEARRFLFHALRLNALLNVREGRSITQAELARAICRRIDLPGDPWTCWSSVSLSGSDRTQDDFRHFEKAISEHLKVARTLGPITPLSRGLLEKAEKKGDRRDFQNLASWTPSEAELDECEWRPEFRRLWQATNLTKSR